MTKQVINYTGIGDTIQDDVQEGSEITIVSVDMDNQVVAFTIDGSKPAVMTGGNIVDTLIGEGIISVLTKAVRGQDGYALQTGDNDESTER